MNLKFKSIIITGASSGIGAAIAELFAGPGISMGLIARDMPRLEQISSKCQQKGATVKTASIDILEKDKLEIWLNEFDDDTAIDLVIANAGITYSLDVTELHESIEELTNVFNTNYLGVMNTVMPVIDRMQQRNKGHIAITSSLSAFHGIPAFPAYSASKSALLSYFQAIRGRLRLSGIDLTIICPGYIQTPMSKRLSGGKLMIMPVDRAANIIKHGIEKRKPLIAFPMLLRLGLRFIGILPTNISTLIFNKLFGIRKK